MTDQSPLPTPDPPSAVPPAPVGDDRPRQPRLRLLLLGVALVLAVGAVVAVRARNDDEPTAPVAGSLELAAPLGDLDRPDAPRVLLSLAPAEPGDNAAAVRITTNDGTPIPGALPEGVRLAVASLDDPAAEREIETRPDRDGAATADLPLDAAGWWRLRIFPGQGGELDDGANFYLLLPDPNLHGDGAVDTPSSDAEAEAVYERGAAATAALHRLRYRQTMADGAGHVALIEHAVNDGSDGQPPTFFYRVQGGSEGYVVGDRGWTRRGGVWEVRTVSPVIPPSAWGEEYEGATGFRLGGVETVDGEPCRIVTFVVPERTEPRHQVAAWYAWWVGEESGQVRRETMVSRAHYMVNESWDFDAAISIAPPPEALAASPPAER